MIDYDKLEKSLKHLELQFQNYKTLDQRTDLGVLEKEAVVESVIQRFEVCYDSLWKVLKRYIHEELGVAEVPNSPKPVFQLAFENNLLSDIVQWKNYANARVATSHDYSTEKVMTTIHLMDHFITDATGLYHQLTGHAWK